MATDVTSVQEIPPGASVRSFIDVAWRCQAGDPAWVPPLRVSVATLLDRRRHPFHRHAEVACFLARRDGVAVGRVAAVVDRRHNEFHAERTGFFGLFECEDDPGTAAALLGAAAGWVRARGMDRLRGPMNLSTNHECGLLVEGFDTPPAVMMPHNPPYYPRLVEAAGLRGTKDLLAYRLDATVPPPGRLVRVARAAARRAGACVRSLDMRRFARDVEIVRDIYNSAWARNWGFVPMTADEFSFAAAELKRIVDPRLCLIVEVRGVPAGFSLALPDLNVALRRLRSGRLLPFGIFRLLLAKRRLPGLRILTLGLRPEHRRQALDACLYLRTWEAAHAAGYRYAEASWVLEDNRDMRRPLEDMGAGVSKVYRIYEKSIW